MLTDATRLHISLFVILSLALIRNASTNTADTAFENSLDALVNLYGNYDPEHRILDSNDLDQYLDDRVKQYFIDYGYSSRTQAGENTVNSLAHGGSYEASGPWKRRFELKGIGNNVAGEMPEKDKRIKTDYGYGSRLQAGENVAMDWDRNGLFGMNGPGKRSDTTGVKEPEMVKRIRADFGYGSRARAAENAAKSASYGELFGVHGPGKRNEVHAPLSGDIPKYGLTKRISSDYGYGSRLQAAENIARLVSSENLFGVNGPGKRSA